MMIFLDCLVALKQAWAFKCTLQTEGTGIHNRGRDKLTTCMKVPEGPSTGDLITVPEHCAAWGGLQDVTVRQDKNRVVGEGQGQQ